MDTYTTFLHVWRSDFEVKLIRVCFRFSKSNLPYLDT